MICEKKDKQITKMYFGKTSKVPRKSDIFKKIYKHLFLSQIKTKNKVLRTQKIIRFPWQPHVDPCDSTSSDIQSLSKRDLD